MATYQHVNDQMLARTADGVTAFIPKDPTNRDYQEYLAWEKAGNVPAPADPEPDPEPTRDERLLVAVDQAKAAVTGSGVFTQQQAATLAAVFDGLGQAITGGGS